MDCTYFFPPALIHFFEEKARFVNALRITFAVLSPRAFARDLLQCWRCFEAGDTYRLNSIPVH
jgi:hypothetical protein